MSSRKPARLTSHGWTVFAHPLFLSQLDALAQQLEALKQKDPVGYVKKNATKRLTAITTLAFDVIPQDPTRPEYRQGGALGMPINTGSERNSFSSTAVFPLPRGEQDHRISMG